MIGLAIGLFIPMFSVFMFLITAMLGNRVSLTFFISNQVAQGLTLKNGLKVK